MPEITQATGGSACGKSNAFRRVECQESDRILISHLLPGEGDRHYLGHFLIEPKRHIEGLGELIDAEAEEIGRMTARLSRALKEGEGAEHVYSFVLGHHVPHLHIHVIPRYPGAPREYWGMRVNEWPDASRGGKEAIEALCERVRKKLT
ncbi:HIT domain-containing protein [Kroppenstedtia eburnea]|nr:HIT domain-containing protein [Kroppenstedtia eburnea]